MKILDLQKSASKTQVRIWLRLEFNNKISKQFEIIEISSNILETFLDIPFDNSDDSAKALHELVRRSHKDLQGIILLATSGLTVQSLSLSRNLVEIELLLRYFVMQLDEITTWWNTDDQTRRHRYSPKRLRNEIARRYPEMKHAMEKDYWGHSELCHPMPQISNKFEDETLLLSSQEMRGIPIAILDTSQHALRIAELIGRLGTVIDPKFDFSEQLKKLEELSPNVLPEETKSKVNST